MLRHYEPPNSERESMHVNTEDHIITTTNDIEEISQTESERKINISKLVLLKINELQFFILYRSLIVLALVIGLVLKIEVFLILVGLTVCFVFSSLVYFQINRKLFTKKTKIEFIAKILTEMFLLSSLTMCAVLNVKYSLCCFALLLSYIGRMYFSCGCSEDVR